MYYYKAELVRVIDGDTIVFDLDLGLHVTKKVHIRVAKFDAPEIRGAERTVGLEIKKKVEKILENCSEIIVYTGKGKSFDRWIGDVIVDGKDLVQRIQDDEE